MNDRPVISLDAVRGMFMGAFLSDSLGNPHEFKCNAKTPYTGLLEHTAFMCSKFQGKRELAVGQVSDDSELTLALLRTMISDRDYNREHVIMSYLRWANSGGWMMGKNTKAVLKGVTTLRGYQNRINKILLLPVSERTQSNGAMMRCSPLALLWDFESVIEDVNITNPNPVCIDCGLVYISGLRLALQGVDGISIFNQVKEIAQTEEVKAVLLQVERREARNIAQNKGWCLHALWCSMVVITSFTNYSEAMNWVITTQPGSDTDTNACIAGALLGASLGFQRMQEEPITAQNIEILLHANIDAGPTPRPREYQVTDFYALTEAAHALTL
jgi:ADP-ribosyl-[dinitrogen reductase] hydrolase